MKRSEAEKVIKRILVSMYHHRVPDAKLTDHKAAAREIMEELLELGMMPPNILDMKTPFYTWEPEE